MPESREPTLPSGMSELWEMIEQRQKKHASDRLIRVESRSACHRLAQRLFPQLCRSIDHDLLFTDQRELVMPLLRETAWEAVKPIANDETKEMMIKMLAEQLWLLIVSERKQRKVTEKSAGKSAH